MHKPAAPELWRTLLAMLRAWPDLTRRANEVVPYVSSHLRDWPMEWRQLDPDRVLLCDQSTSEVMLRRWNSTCSDILPLVSEDAQWLRHVIAHLEYDVRHAVKLQPLIHAGAFSRVRSVTFSHHENPRDFLSDLRHVLMVRGTDTPLEQIQIEACFFHDEAAECLMKLVDVSAVRTVALNHSIKPSAISMLCDEAWEGVRNLELTGDLLRLEDVRVLLQSKLCVGLDRLRVGYLLDARGEDVQPLVRELAELLESRAPKLTSLSLPGLHLTGRAMRRLAESEGMRHVRALDLRDNMLSVEAMEVLCGPNSAFEQLEHVRLGQWLIQDDMIHTLLTSPLAARLKTLDVARCDLNPLTHVSLLSREHLPVLEHLALSGVRCSRALFERVARTQPADRQGLETLVLDQAEHVDGEDLTEVVQSTVGRWWRAHRDVEVSMTQTRASRLAVSWAQSLRCEAHRHFTLCQPGTRAGEGFERHWREEV